MSFDISGPGPSRKPVIREAQTMENNGGGGNLGYMQSGRKKKDEEDEFESEINADVNEEEGGDLFSRESDDEYPDDEEEQNEHSFLKKIKGFINKEKSDSK